MACRNKVEGAAAHERLCAVLPNGSSRLLEVYRLDLASQSSIRSRVVEIGRSCFSLLL